MRLDMRDVLAGRVALITGAAGGLGAEYARSFAHEGARLVLTDRTESSKGESSDALGALVAELRSLGAEVVGHQGDVGTEECANSVVSLAVERFGALDVVVNNAGNWHEGKIEDTSVESFDSIVQTHLRGHFLTLRAAARHWASEHRRGRPVAASVINTTSRSALHGIIGHSAYAAAKGGIIALTHVAANELKPYGVRVNCVAPAGRTGMTLAIAALADEIRRTTGTDSFDEWDPVNVAPLVTYLATRNCQISGEILFARGGTVQRYEWAHPAETISRPSRWTVADLAVLLPKMLSGPGQEQEVE